MITTRRAFLKQQECVLEDLSSHFSYALGESRTPCERVIDVDLGFEASMSTGSECRAVFGLQFGSFDLKSLCSSNRQRLCQRAEGYIGREEPRL